MEIATRLQRKLRTAAWLLIAGLVVEGVTIHLVHPLSFVFFIVVGGVLVLAGIVIYLFAIVTA